MKEETERRALTFEEAWDDFYQNVRPGIWANLSRTDRDQILKAQRAREGRAPRKLGWKRVERILSECAPGRYEVEVRVVFWLG